MYHHCTARANAMVDYSDIASLPNDPVGGAGQGGKPVQPAAAAMPAFLEPYREPPRRTMNAPPPYDPDQFNVHTHPYFPTQPPLAGGAGIAGGAGGHAASTDSRAMPLPPNDIPATCGSDRALDPAAAHYHHAAMLQQAAANMHQHPSYHGAVDPAAEYRKQRDAQIGQFIDAIQIPLLVTLLFFAVNTSTVTNWLVAAAPPGLLFTAPSALPAPPLVADDGSALAPSPASLQALQSAFGGGAHLSTTGLVAKSLLFGALYYAVTTLLSWY